MKKEEPDLQDVNQPELDLALYEFVEAQNKVIVNLSFSLVLSLLLNCYFLWRVL